MLSNLRGFIIPVPIGVMTLISRKLLMLSLRLVGVADVELSVGDDRSSLVTSLDSEELSEYEFGLS